MISKYILLYIIQIIQIYILIYIILIYIILIYNNNEI